jgi:hypothetical protein
MAGGRFIALTTSDKRAMLEKAWRSCSDDAQSLMEELQRYRDESSGKASDGVQNMSANGHSAGTFFPGQNAPTDAELTRGWTELIDLYRNMRSFLKNCARYGLEVFPIYCNASWPSPLPAELPANQRIIIDEPSWESLADQYDVDLSKVVGVAVGEEAIYLFMLLGLVPATQTRTDFSEAITGRGGAPV